MFSCLFILLFFSNFFPSFMSFSFLHSFFLSLSLLKGNKSAGLNVFIISIFPFMPAFESSESTQCQSSPVLFVPVLTKTVSASSLESGTRLSGVFYLTRISRLAVFCFVLSLLLVFVHSSAALLSHFTSLFLDSFPRSRLLLLLLHFFSMPMNFKKETKLSPDQPDNLCRKLYTRAQENIKQCIEEQWRDSDDFASEATLGKMKLSCHYHGDENGSAGTV